MSEQIKLLNPYTGKETVVLNEDGSATCPFTGVVGLESIEDIDSFKNTVFSHVLDNFSRFFDGRFWCPPSFEHSGVYLFPIPMEDGDVTNWRWEVGVVTESGEFESLAVYPREEYSKALYSFTENVAGKTLINESQTNQNDTEEIP